MTSPSGHATTALHGGWRILVTGGTGTLGLNIVEQLLWRAMSVTVLASEPPPRSVEQAFARCPGTVEFLEGSVLTAQDLGRALDRTSFDAVIHAAAVTPSPLHEADQAHTVLDVNVMGTVNVVRAAATAQVGRVVYVGSIAAYGAMAAGLETSLVEEVTPDRPVTVYEVSKHTAELAALRLGSLLGLQVVSARVGDVFGRWERQTKTRTLLSGPVQVATKLRNGDRAILPEAGDRHWLYAIDAARAIAALSVAPRLCHRLYNVGGADRWSLLSWGELIARALGRGEVVVDPAAADVLLFADHPPQDLRRLAQDTAYRPSHGLRAAAADYLGWLREHDGAVGAAHSQAG